MSITDTALAPETHTHLPVLFQYTVEAYKVFEKLAENLPNPVSAAMFRNFAEDERSHRDLLELKYRGAGERMKITLGGDLRFQDILEGDLSFREISELLTIRERTMERKLSEASNGASEEDRNLFHYIAASKRAHAALLERELYMTRMYPDWFRREDAEDLIVHGRSAR